MKHLRMTRTSKTASTPRSRGASLTSVAIAAILSMPAAHGQTVEGLRLATSERPAGDALLKRRLLDKSAGDLTAATRSSYIPQSEGAVADEELQDPSLYDEAADPADGNATDLFELNRRPEAPRLPLGAATRASDDSETTFDDPQNDPQAEIRTASPRTGTESADGVISTGRTTSLANQDEERNLAADPDSIRTGTVDGQSPEADDDPYAAVGIRAGSFILRPSLETGITATTNADSGAGGGPGVLSQTILRLEAASDWLRHAATLGASLAWEHPVSPSGPGRPEINVDGTLRLDLAGDHQDAEADARDHGQRGLAEDVRDIAGSEEALGGEGEEDEERDKRDQQRELITADQRPQQLEGGLRPGRGGEARRLRH